MRSFKEGCIIGTSFDQHEMEFDHSCNAHSLFSHLMFANSLSGIKRKIWLQRMRMRMKKQLMTEG